MRSTEQDQEPGGCAKSIFWLAGGTFIFASIIVIFAFLIGGEGFVDKFVDPDSDSVNLSLLRFAFIIAIIAFLVYLFKGGKANKIFDK